ncbi:glycosyltransferase family 2 protein [Wenzhouxiangella sp. EGI_FJ10305]|uniref:glycosyltransferase family 2 protein n=1 Tax=Wenzhouxiangella sp. EGI_FJ10305 TaxID=3243768 RepID=UPI0035E105DF
MCSIIIPVYNHWHLVPTLLDCLARQTLPQDAFETMLVDNGSEVFEPPESLPANARIITCETPGSYAARNRGIEKARGDWLVFTDADCRPRPDWLENLMAATNQLTDRGGRGLQAANKRTSEQANEQTLLAGPVEMVPQNDPPNRWEIYDLVRGIPQVWYVKRGYAATANLAVSAALMGRLGGFDAARMSGGDAEFCRRAAVQGASLEYIPGAIVEHPARSTRPELVAKLRRIKAGQVGRGDWRRRLRTFLPPVIESWKYLRATRWPVGYRLRAIVVQLSLWPVEIGQALHSNPSNR